VQLQTWYKLTLQLVAAGRLLNASLTAIHGLQQQDFTHNLTVNFTPKPISKLINKMFIEIFSIS
jgi:hypothetical protein